MRIIEWPRFLEESRPFGEKRSSVTVGIFDGVHRGHQSLIGRVVSQKDSSQTLPVVITFKQGRHKKAQGDILSFRQKTAIFESLGVAVTIVIEFSESFRRMRGADFLQILHEHGNMGFMAAGGNFRCGYQLDTDAAAIRDFNSRRSVPTDIIQPLTEGQQPISSALIRTAVTRGELRAAAAMLGRPFTVDLDGASVSDAGGRAYDIAGLGRILPPPGRYQVTLLDKSLDRSAGRQTEISIKDGNVITGGDTADFIPEYAEFQ
jgi:riboflavin kinase/FMN adenylyltransferase